MMRLIGGKDYYDGATGFDTDTARVFVRENHNTVEMQKHPILSKYRRHLYFKRSFFGYEQPTDYSCISIIFCGKVYNCIYYNRRTNYPSVKYYQPGAYIEKMFWHKEPFLKHITENGEHLAQRSLHGYEYDARAVDLKTIDEFFEPKIVSKEVMDYLIENNILIAIEKSYKDKRYIDQDGKWFVNTDGLKDYAFGSIVDPFTANQELDMFLGTILVKDEDKRVQVSDESKAKKRGFDKMSFRNTHHQGKPRNQKKAKA